MKKYWYLFLIISSAFFTGCSKEEGIAPEAFISCSNLTEALIEIDPELVGAEINSFLEKFKANPTEMDEYGHKGTFENLIEKINVCPNLEVVSSCYNCIYTNPPQSEILISITGSNQELRRTLGLQHKEGKFIFVGLHD